MGFRIAPYGRSTAVAGTAILLACAGALYFVHPLAALAPVPFEIFLLSFFRDPDRAIPDGPGLLVSPADGKVTAIDEVDDAPYLGGRAWRVSIFLSVFNAHVNRAPAAGRVAYLAYRPGKFLDARHPACAAENEQNWIGFERTEPGGGRLLVKQISGAIARRIVCAVAEGEPVGRGQRLGMIKFGSRTELYVPVAMKPEPKVKVGDAVRAGSTVLASLPVGAPSAASSVQGG